MITHKDYDDSLTSVLRNPAWHFRSAIQENQDGIRRPRDRDLVLIFPLNTTAISAKIPSYGSVIEAIYCDIEKSAAEVQ